ncbi:MAG: histidine kinase dimerization/phospho-acceptor domain-containing protein, partial [Planctomycetota bacterium]
MPNLWRWISLLGLTWLFSQGFPKLAAREADESAPLRTVDEIHGLPPTEEIGRDVFVEIPAQVTYYSPKWPILFIHDGVTGMYVEAKRDFPFANGDQVVVRGRVGPGRYIVDASLEPNPGPPISLPKARRSEHKFLNGGHLDSQWVELEAWLVGLSEHVHHHRLEFRLNVTERFSALIDTSLVSEAYLTRWIREKIRVRGTVGAVVHPNGKFAGFQIWIRKIEDVELIRDESLPSPHSIENVSTLHRRNEDAPRSLEIAKVRGRAVRTVGQHGLFVRDESGVIFVESLRALTIQEGETVVAHGLLRGEPLRLEAARVDASLPVLEKLPSPELRDASELTTLPFDHSWVRTQGYVLESLRETEHVRLLLRSENTVFSAFVSGAEAAEVSAGTKVELTGVCVTRSALEHGHETFELYATPDGIRLLPSVPWELFATVAALAALVAGLSLLWARQLQHRVREQTDRIKEQFEQREVERKEFQERLLRSHKLESLGLLAGGIAHDFNNILQGILGNALLAQEVLGEASPAQENLDQIDKSSQRAADLTQQMLAYAGRGKFHIERVELSKLIESTTELIRSSLSKENGVEFELDSHLPLVEGDPSQLQQVVMNLLINASE